MCTLVLVFLFCGVIVHSQETCHPFLTTPVYTHTIPTFTDVVGFDFGERQATWEELYLYLDVVAEASDRVLGPFELLYPSVLGKPLRYVLISNPAHLSPEGLAQVQANISKIMDPDTSAGEAYDLSLHTPSFVWMAAAVHGNEPSGADAGVRAMYELTDRSDCAARQILDNTVFVMLPTQNPDGRAANERRNANGFDMNRDWFAMTQPETKGKVDALLKYPPVLFLDDHEMGSATYFFPPNADPYYHEISYSSVEWINDLYGGAMQDEFDRQGIDYFNEELFDLFYAGYGDSFPTLAFNAAGITLEKCNYNNYSNKTYEQFVAQWTSISAAAVNKTQVLSDWHQSFVEAREQGRDGILQPNRVYNDGSDVVFEVPPGLVVRSYFIWNDNPSKAVEVAAVINRLELMGVQVETLPVDTVVAPYTAYGRGTQTYHVLPAGTYAVSMEQPKKHFVQAMMNDNTYVAFPFFYDLTGWSAPFLENTPGGYSSEAVSTLLKSSSSHNKTILAGANMRKQPAPVPVPVPAPAAQRINPVVVVLQENDIEPFESFDWLVFTMREKWNIDFSTVLVADLANQPQLLDFATVVVIPDLYSSAQTYDNLGDAGRNAIVDFVERSSENHLIGIHEGSRLAMLLNLTDGLTFSPPVGVSCPGALFRVYIDVNHPLAEGVGREYYQFYDDFHLIMQAAEENVLAYFPLVDTPDWFVSGFQEGAELLEGTTAVAQFVGGSGGAGGVVTTFAMEMNYRAFTSGSAKLVYNAIFLLSSSSVVQLENQTRKFAVPPPSPPQAAVVVDNNNIQAVDGWRGKIKLRVTSSLDIDETTLTLQVKHACQIASSYQVSDDSLTFLWKTDAKGKHEHVLLLSNPEKWDREDHPWLARLPGIAKRDYKLNVVIRYY